MKLKSIALVVVATTTMLGIVHPARAAGMQPCGEASTQTGRTLKVTGSIGFTPIRTGPSENFDKIVNQKATDMLHTTQFKTIDDSETVYEECTQSGWSKIGVTEPNWLPDDKGWVPSRLLAPGR